MRSITDVLAIFSNELLCLALLRECAHARRKRQWKGLWTFFEKWKTAIAALDVAQRAAIASRSKPTATVLF
jgi:hypothetical protein